MPISSFGLRALIISTVLSLGGGGLLHATSVVAPSFAELVAEAETIVRARVLSVRAAWVDSPQGRVIKTYVTFATQRQLKGRSTPQFTLELFGGELDGQGMRIAGLPQFEAGQSEMLFVSGNGVQFCPLVGLMHGRYRIRTDPANAREYLTRNDGVPLVSEHDVQLPQGANPLEARTKTVAAALSPLAFEQRINVELSRRATLH